MASFPSLRSLASLLLLVSVPLTGASCGLILGIEGVEEIQGNGGGGSGGAPTTGNCQPGVCDPSWYCGSVENSCGQIEVCKVCPNGFNCNKTTHQCEAQPAACEEQNAECGMLMVAGTTVNCGDCTEPGHVCNTDNHRCECTPVECSIDGGPWECGMGDNGCGNMLDCGACSSGPPCSLNHKCNCTPTVCGTGAADWECGSGTEPCGADLMCGDCAANHKCENHKCVCVPQDPCNANGYECGSWSDGCGKMIVCGDCNVICANGGTCDTMIGKCNCL